MKPSDVMTDPIGSGRTAVWCCRVPARPPSVHPPLDCAGYRSTALRAPKHAAGPAAAHAHRGHRAAARRRAGRRRSTHDLTRQHAGRAAGPADHRARPRARRRRPAGAAHAGRDLAGQRRPAATRTRSTSTPRRSTRTSPASGRCVTDAEGRYRFVTIKPGAYPWGNHHNAWRPAHIHFSLFGRAFTQRLVTQMYFPGDPLFAQDPIFNSVPRPEARAADDLPLRPRRPPSRSGRSATAGTSCCAAARRPRSRSARRVTLTVTPVADRRPVLRHRPALAGRPATSSRRARPGAIWIRGTVLDGAGEPVPDALIETWQADPDGLSTTPTTRAAPTASFRGFGRAATDDEGRWCGPHGQARAGAGPRRHAPRRRTSTCRSSPADCSTAWSPGSTSPTRRPPTRPTRCSPRCRRPPR